MTWETLRPYVGLFCLLAGIASFLLEVWNGTVHSPHLVGDSLLALFGAFCLNENGAEDFVNMIVRIAPWSRVAKDDIQDDKNADPKLP